LERVGDTLVLVGAELVLVLGLFFRLATGAAGLAVAALAVAAARALAVRIHARGGAIPAVLRIARVARRLVRLPGVLLERDVIDGVRVDDDLLARGLRSRLDRRPASAVLAGVDPDRRAAGVVPRPTLAAARRRVLLWQPALPA